MVISSRGFASNSQHPILDFDSLQHTCDLGVVFSPQFYEQRNSVLNIIWLGIELKFIMIQLLLPNIAEEFDLYL